VGDLGVTDGDDAGVCVAHFEAVAAAAIAVRALAPVGGAWEGFSYLYTVATVPLL
jgi:hypothetical protein